jgi:hypothetical protein
MIFLPSGGNVIAQADDNKDRLRALAICALDKVEKTNSELQVLIVSPFRDDANAVGWFSLQLRFYTFLFISRCNYISDPFGHQRSQQASRHQCVRFHCWFGSSS